MSKSQFKRGMTVRQIMPAPIVGIVTEIGICPNEGDRLFKVVWPDANGDGIEESRFFKESEIEAVDE
jgi:hypothetical protein